MEEGGSCVVESVEGVVVVVVVVEVVVVVADGFGGGCEVGGVIDDSRLLRKSRSSASACSSRVNCRLGFGSGCDDFDGCCRLSGCCVGRLSGCAFLLLEDDDHHQPIVNIFIGVNCSRGCQLYLICSNCL